MGTLVWDTIHARDPGRGVAVEEWGGIAYALAAFEAAAEDDWTLVPIIKVGADLRERANRFLARLERIDSLDGVRTVPEPNNRVELHYRSRERRCEKLTGGVPGWSAEELVPLARSCDALYVNFIAGWELELPAARRLRDEVGGPVYCDVHSLLLGVRRDGVRVPRPLEAWREWLACFDIVQCNEDELRTLTGASGDPWRLVAEVLGPRTKALLVTLGARGAAWLATDDFRRRPLLRAPGGVERPPATVTSGQVENARPVEEADPTGCGDVWGMTCFAGLLAGRELEDAMRRANRFAARNASLRGASGLPRALASEGGILLGEGE